MSSSSTGANQMTFYISDVGDVSGTQIAELFAEKHIGNVVTVDLVPVGFPTIPSAEWVLRSEPYRCMAFVHCRAFSTVSKTILDAIRGGGQLVTAPWLGVMMTVTEATEEQSLSLSRSVGATATHIRQTYHDESSWSLRLRQKGMDGTWYEIDGGKVNEDEELHWPILPHDATDLRDWGRRRIPTPLSGLQGPGDLSITTTALITALKHHADERDDEELVGDINRAIATLTRQNRIIVDKAAENAKLTTALLQEQEHHNRVRAAVKANMSAIQQLNRSHAEHEKATTKQQEAQAWLELRLGTDSVCDRG